MRATCADTSRDLGGIPPLLERASALSSGERCELCLRARSRPVAPQARGAAQSLPHAAPHARAARSNALGPFHPHNPPRSQPARDHVRQHAEFGEIASRLRGRRRHPHAQLQPERMARPSFSRACALLPRGLGAACARSQL
eukprot:5753876-Pleurochrysis_carterae.AAC.1